MQSALNKLDNPVWHALLETHQELCLDFNGTKFYHPDYCPFGAFENDSNIANAISEYAKLTNDFFIVGNKPDLPTDVHLSNELICDQMVIDAPLNINPTEKIVLLTREHHTELFNLVNLVQPGYFRNKTHALGNYFGIFIDEQLVAVSGERMQMKDMVEVSAVVTHPDHTGKGYARQLVSHTVNTIRSSDKIAFLHVAETNRGAISVYEKLGFKLRRKISFWHLRS